VRKEIKEFRVFLETRAPKVRKEIRVLLAQLGWQVRREIKGTRVIVAYLVPLDSKASKERRVTKETPELLVFKDQPEPSARKVFKA
jgi:hypothetical protein